MKPPRLSSLFHSPYTRVAIYVIAFAAVAFLAYLRYPTYLTEPNFYAEDGTVFAKNIVDKGFWSALATPFNGYFVAGIYLLEGVAFLLNNLFWDGSLLNQAPMLGLVSYAFWAFLATLPIMLFWNDFKNKLWFVPMTLCLALMPLPSFNYAVLGTVGNYKFAFLFIAFLLIIKRWRLPKTSKWLFVIDAGIILCLLTNVTVYLLLPFMLISYWPGRKKPVWGLFRDKTFLSMGVVFMVAALQILYVAFHGVEDMPGYLKEPYLWGRTIEIFLHRATLFPLDFVFLKHLSDLFVVGLFVAVVGFLLRLSRGYERKLLLLGLWAILGGTALFVSQRTGVSQFFGDYQASGTDHFFYAQNMIFIFVFIYIVARFAEETRRRQQQFVFPAALTLFSLIALGMIVVNDFGRNAQLNRGVGTVWYGAQQECEGTNKPQLAVPTYPVGAQSLVLDRSYCTAALKRYIPPRVAVPIAPYNNNYVPVNSQRVTQTFQATYNELSGISVFFSTFGGGGKAWYKLELLDQTCRERIRSSTFLAEQVQDNSYYDIRFAPIAHSRGQEYCFIVLPEKLVPGKPPLAIQLSAPEQYLRGVANNGRDLQEDVVFDLLYKTNR